SFRKTIFVLLLFIRRISRDIPIEFPQKIPDKSTIM
ncbi:uncharacterized protein METZ01_LOCUS478016, partial [marine metagenome]